MPCIQQYIFTQGIKYEVHIQSYGWNITNSYRQQAVIKVNKREPIRMAIETAVVCAEDSSSGSSVLAVGDDAGPLVGSVALGVTVVGFSVTSVGVTVDVASVGVTVDVTSVGLSGSIPEPEPEPENTSSSGEDTFTFGAGSSFDAVRLSRLLLQPSLHSGSRRVAIQAAMPAAISSTRSALLIFSK